MATHSRFLTISLAAGCLIVAGCGTPDSLSYRTGAEPQHIDQDVRFRSTYYFRVFDVCNDPAKPGKNSRIMLDSLYRFQMTGKANLTTIKFDAGTLHKDEIDPFGTTVAYNEAIGGYEVRSRDEVETAAREARDWAEVERIRQNLLELQKYENVEAFKNARQQLQSLLERKLQSLGADKAGMTPTRNGEDDKSSPGCPEGWQARRGFQILGPEGFRTFNQDERLYMAMTSSAKPLIQALRQASAEVLQNKVRSTPNLLLAREQAVTSRAARKVRELAATDGISAEALIAEALASMKSAASPVDTPALPVTASTGTEAKVEVRNIQPLSQ